MKQSNNLLGIVYSARERPNKSEPITHIGRAAKSWEWEKKILANAEGRYEWRINDVSAPCGLLIWWSILVFSRWIHYRYFFLTKEQTTWGNIAHFIHLCENSCITSSGLGVTEEESNFRNMLIIFCTRWLGAEKLMDKKVKPL